MNVPLVDLRKQYTPLKDDILERVGAALDGMHLFLGENVQALEKEFAAFCGVAYGIGVSDGTAPCSSSCAPWGSGRGMR